MRHRFLAYYSVCLCLLTCGSTYAQQAAPKPSSTTNTGPTRYALIITSSDYSMSNSLPSLPGTSQEADAIMSALERGGFPKQNITRIDDNATSERDRPTRENIRRAIAAFYQRARNGVAIVFLTGHGVTIENECFYCPTDTIDAAFASAATARQQLVSVQEIALQFSKQCQATHKLVVVDACRNDGGQTYSGVVKAISALEQPCDNVWLMSSCSEGQRSWISSQIRAGEQRPIFSHFVAEGLEGSADILGDNDGRVSLFELFTYAYRKTRDTSAALESKDGVSTLQTPELFGMAAPFELAEVGSLLATRTLTTGDIPAEAGRSADHLADEMLARLRMADYQYRKQENESLANEAKRKQLSLDYYNYLCHLTGNRIPAALALDPQCKLAHIAVGIAHRTTGEYQEAIRAFTEGGEQLELFVKADVNKLAGYVARDTRGNPVLDQSGQTVSKLSAGSARDRVGIAYLYGQPGDPKPAWSVLRQSKVTVSDIQTVNEVTWLLVTHTNDLKTAPAWINASDVHWLPHAIDVYTPSTAMRTFSGGVGSSANRIDYAASRLDQLSQTLALPAQRLEQLARPFEQAAGRLDEIAYRASQPTRLINNGISRLNGSIIGRFVSIPYVPNPVADYLGVASSYVRRPAGYVYTASSYARIPSNYVQTARGYVSMPSQYLGMARGVAAASSSYRAATEQQTRIETTRKELANSGNLPRIEARPIQIAALPW